MRHIPEGLIVLSILMLPATPVLAHHTEWIPAERASTEQRPACCWEDILRISEIFLPFSVGDTQALAEEQDPGHQVGIVVYHVRPDKKQAFEQFVTGVLMPAAWQAEPGTAAKVRFVTSADLHPDGTYHDVFLFDPVVPGGEYEIENILDQVYGKKKRAQFMKTFATYVTGYTDESFTELR